MRFSPSISLHRLAPMRVKDGMSRRDCPCDRANWLPRGEIQAPNQARWGAATPTPIGLSTPNDDVFHSMGRNIRMMRRYPQSLAKGKRGSTGNVDPAKDSFVRIGAAMQRLLIPSNKIPEGTSNYAQRTGPPCHYTRPSRCARCSKSVRHSHSPYEFPGYRSRRCTDFLRHPLARRAGYSI